MRVDLGAMTMMSTAQQWGWRERGQEELEELGGQEGVMEWATCSSYLSRMYG